jgi:hypothetical protein
MAGKHDKYRESGLAALVDGIRATTSRFDAAALAAADRIRDAELRLVEGTVTQAEAQAISDAACAVFPHAPDLVALLSNLDGLPVRMQGALPELVNETNFTRIAAVLRFIDNELNSYLGDSDAAHLTNALDTGLQNFHHAMQRSFGYWQMSRDPARWPPVAVDLDLSPERRDKLTGKLLAALQRWIPGSRTELRGSLGTGTADGYSDIDICWVVSEEDFTEAVDTLGAALSQCAAVLALRTDPQYARSAAQRVVFARLYGLPLFWRVDIDIRTVAVAADDRYDSVNPDARSDAGWSAPASAIENAVAAIKAAVRGQADTVDDLLRRGCERIGHDPGPHTDVAAAITGLADACATREPRLTRMTAEIHQVADRLLRQEHPEYEGSDLGGPART